MTQLPSGNVQPPSAVRSYLQALRDNGFRGDTADDYASRVTYATDNSIYQVMPQAVLYPRIADDLNLILKVAAAADFEEISFSPRGGGTGANGQSLNTGVIIDLSRHMTAIGDFDESAGLVTVEPGVVLDQLNHFLKARGYFFPPNVSTASRATIGGMVGTDASGKGSRIYGKTSDHIESMDVVLWDGSDLTIGPLEGAELEEVLARQDHSGRIHRQVYDSVSQKRDEIENVFPKLNRGLTGYNLKHAFDDNGTLRLPYLIAGSEGTLCVIKSITCRITRIPLLNAVVAVRYANYQHALRAVPLLLEADPSAIEFVDDKIMTMAQSADFWGEVQDILGGRPGEPPAKALHFVEFIGDSQNDLQQRVERLIEILESQAGDKGAATGWRIATDPGQTAVLWDMRKKCQGLLAGLQTEKRAVPFIEDTVVPPESLAVFVKELRVLLERHDIDVGMFGHADVGCLHIRPMLDLTEERDVNMVRTISDEVVVLTKKYGGLLWGEHGKGYRGEYSPAYLGPGLYDELRKIKDVFDPHNKLNPGKLATPKSMRDAAVNAIDGVPLKGGHDRQIRLELRADFPKSTHCNGNGACFTWDRLDPMCPSYKATRDRVHSPKGRAGLIREWMRIRSQPDQMDQAEFEELCGQVYDAMDGCLSCKACAGGSCPVRIDIPEMKSRFLSWYHETRPRPLKDHLLARLETLTPVLGRFARATNAVQKTELSKMIAKSLFGLVDLPSLSIPTLNAGLRSRPARVLDADALDALRPVDRQRAVVIVQDCFTSYYDASVVLAHCDLLERIGYRVFLAPYRPSGKPLHVKGFLSSFDHIAEFNDAAFRRLAGLGMPLIGIDPSITLSYRHEYSERANKGSSYEIQLFPEWLASALEVAQFEAPPTEPLQFHLLQHCTERCLVPETTKQWSKIFNAFGLSLDIIDVGCCGMAGVYGHEVSNQVASKRLYDLTWRDVVKEADPDHLLATGFSCRSQVERLSGIRVAHPVEALFIASSSLVPLNKNGMAWSAQSRSSDDGARQG